MLYAFCLLLIASTMLLLNHSGCFVPFGVIIPFGVEGRVGVRGGQGGGRGDFRCVGGLGEVRGGRGGGTGDFG